VRALRVHALFRCGSGQGSTKRCASRESWVTSLVPGHGDSSNREQGNGTTDLIPGSDSYRLPCGPQVDRCSFARGRPAARPFAETSCLWAPAPSPPTSCNGGKLRAAGSARRALCSPTLFAAAPAVNLPAAVSLSGERQCAGDPIAARTPEASTFSATFRKLVGRTPTDYRRSLPPGKA
jgi:hypothetical protein